LYWGLCRNQTWKSIHLCVTTATTFLQFDMQKVGCRKYLDKLVWLSIATFTELSLEAKKIQIDCLNNKIVLELSLVVSNVYLSLIERDPIFVFIAFLDRSCRAKKEFHLSVVIKPILTKLKINTVLLALSSKTLPKFSQAGCQILQVSNWVGLLLQYDRRTAPCQFFLPFFLSWNNSIPIMGHSRCIRRGNDSSRHSSRQSSSQGAAMTNTLPPWQQEDQQQQLSGNWCFLPPPIEGTGQRESRHPLGSDEHCNDCRGP
jgi:hypothetical protein